MPAFLEKIVGFNKTIDFSWDLLLTQRKTQRPHISRLDLVVRHRYNVFYFYRFLENLFFRYPHFTFFKLSKVAKLKFKNPFFKGRRRRRSPYLATLTFTHNLSLFFYFIIFVVLRAEVYTRHFGTYFASLYLKELNSYNFRYIHDFSQDDNWRVYPSVRVYFNKITLSRPEKRQFFSLFKVFDITQK